MSSLRIALVLLASLALTAPLQAQVGEEEEAASFAMTGTVKAVDAAKHTLSIDAPNREGGVLDVDPKAEILNGDQQIGLADVKVGWRVVLNGDLRGEKRVVTYLELVEAP
jgi:uncharacterized ubiquitin-like protein YukD